MKAILRVMLLLCPLAAANAADLNYIEFRGHVTGTETHQDANGNYTKVVLRILDFNRTKETISLDCMLPSPAGAACQDAGLWLSSCTSIAVAQSVGPTDVATFRQCVDGVGRCAWAWGYVRNTASGAPSLFVEALWKRSETDCTPL